MKLLLAACLALTPALAVAQPAAKGDAPVAAPQIQRSVTQHAGVFGGRKLSYVATAGETILKDAKGAPAASLFTFSYVEKGGKADRPVVFVFNGGPGSSSVWLHMGMLGPRQIAFPDPIHPPTTPPFKMADNPLSLLDAADLVFIDPVGTGFSRTLPGGRTEDYYGVNQDARSMAEFIQAWLTENGRWNSPKFLLGESYGTIRASVLAQALTGGPFSATGTLGAVTLNGVIILGPAFGGNNGGDQAYLTSLPTMAASALVHGKIAKAGATSQSVAEEARQFAADDYLRALYAGEDLPAAERRRIAERLAALTGLSAETWLAQNLRISLSDFGKLLLKDQGQQIGAYDSRYTLPLAASGGDPVADDPAMAQYTPGFVAAFNDYVRTELKVTAPATYQAISFGEVNSRWSWGSPSAGLNSRNYATDLATAQRRNPALKVFIGTGYYDLVTTFGAAEYALRQSGLAKDRTELKIYPSGHMPYLGEESAKILGADVRAFLKSATTP